MADIRRIEDETQAELNKEIKQGQVKGLASTDEKPLNDEKILFLFFFLI
jgi:hypothetical protein